MPSLFSHVPWEATGKSHWILFQNLCSAYSPPRTLCCPAALCCHPIRVLQRLPHWGPTSMLAPAPHTHSLKIGGVLLNCKSDRVPLHLKLCDGSSLCAEESCCWSVDLCHLGLQPLASESDLGTRHRCPAMWPSLTRRPGHQASPIPPRWPCRLRVLPPCSPLWRSPDPSHSFWVIGATVPCLCAPCRWGFCCLVQRCRSGIENCAWHPVGPQSAFVD